jgi:hypothetical protein
VLEPIEHIILIVIHNLHIALFAVCYELGLVYSDTGLHVKEVGVGVGLDKKYLAVSGKGGILQEVFRVGLLYKRSEVLVLIKEDGTLVLIGGGLRIVAL